jgi:hypothetical protein
MLLKYRVNSIIILFYPQKGSAKQEFGRIGKEKEKRKNKKNI